MAMRAQLWNTHQLAVEFGLSYRVAAARLADVEIVEMRGKMAMYRLSEAAPALLGAGHQAAAPASEPSEMDFRRIGAPFSVGSDPFTEVFALAILWLAERVPAVAANCAVVAGAPLAVAFALYELMVLAMAAQVDELAEKASITWRREDHHGAPLEANWSHLAAITGEKVDRRAWQRYGAKMVKRFAPLPEGES
jgi:hypothetical protein